MIRSLRGEVLNVSGNQVLLDVNGLGFDILCSRAAVELCDGHDSKPVRLVTYLQIAESGVALYGFASELERELFLKFTSIKGIGGRTGMAILSGLSVGEVAKAVSFADVSAFTRVPGIGRKTAERLCFELKNLMADMDLSSADIGDADTGNSSFSSNAHQSSARVIETVTEALLSLGFQQSEARQAIAMVKAARGADNGDFDSLTEEELLRLALKTLHRGR